MSLSLDQALEMAEQALETGEFEDALAFADQALAKAPNDLDGLELKALALGELGDWEQADGVFAKLLHQAPGHVTGLIAAADVKIRQPGDDRERIEEGLELLDQAEPKARQDEALTIELELLRGIAFNQLGEFEEALDAFARVLHLDPEHGEAQLEQALGLFEQGRFADAKKAFERLSKDFPEEPWSFHYLGLLAERRGEDPEPWFQKARAIDPEEFPPGVHMTSDEFDAAVEKAITALPEHARPHLENALVNVEPIPSDEEIKEGLSPTILGVFHGTPIDERLDTAATHHETVRITLFQKNLERFARTKEELEEEIRITVLHEVGHLLGLDEDELYERGLD
ncbi:MAG TPA: metallopeptidase family protein [Archangium sp.]